VSSFNPNEGVALIYVMTPEQEIILDLVLNGEMGMSAGIQWAIRNGYLGFAEYLKTF